MKWWRVTKFDVGRELVNPDYAAQLEAENQALLRVARAATAVHSYVRHDIEAYCGWKFYNEWIEALKEVEHLIKEPADETE